MQSSKLKVKGGNRRLEGLAAGWLVLGGAAAMTFLSFSFRYGENHVDRPILWFLFCYLLIWLGLLLAVRRIRSGRGMSLAVILSVGVLSRMLLLPSSLIQENDVYRYLFDGQNLLRGENPYLQSPTEIRLDPSHPLRGDLTDPAASLVLERIGFPEVPTVYPPLAQACFVVGALLGGWDWRGLRVLFLWIDLLVLIVLLGAQRAMALDRRWVVLYAWNPLVLKEVANSVHLDVLLCLLLGILVWVLASRKKPTLTPILAGMLLGLLTLTKLYPVLLLPVVSAWLYRRFRRLAAPLLCGATWATILVGGYLPFLGDGISPLLRGLTIYGRHWVMNEGAFSLLALITDKARVVVLLIVLLLALLIAWKLARPHRADLVRALQLLLLLWLLLIPTPYPWYSLPLLALGCLGPDSAAGRTTLGLSLLLALYYLSFYFEYRDAAPSAWVVTRCLEHGALWAWLGWSAVQNRRSVSRSGTQTVGSPSRP